MPDREQRAFLGKVYPKKARNDADAFAEAKAHGFRGSSLHRAEPR